MPKKPTEFQLTELKIPIMTGTAFDLTRFDFLFKDITIYDIQSEAFEKYIESLQPDAKENNLDFINEITKTIHFDHERKYAIVNNNPRKHYNYQDIINVWRLLLIIYPSDLQIEYVVEYENYEGAIHNASMSSWDKRMTGEYPGDLLIASDTDIDEVNEFAKNYFDELNLENYIGIAIENYLTSFSASHLHYEYLTLCIALESIVHGDNELTYRLRRTTAVLCGKDIYNCDIIYDNLNTLYKLRSKIIHGEEYSMAKVKEFIQPLKAIVSRAIIELLIHNIPTNKELNEVITRLAFGDRNKISNKWKPYRLNISTVVDSNWKRLS